jgi:hypothetical protein
MLSRHPSVARRSILVTVLCRGSGDEELAMVDAAPTGKLKAL